MLPRRSWGNGPFHVQKNWGRRKEKNCSCSTRSSRRSFVIASNSFSAPHLVCTSSWLSLLFYQYKVWIKSSCSYCSRWMRVNSSTFLLLLLLLTMISLQVLTMTMWRLLNSERPIMRRKCYAVFNFRKVWLKHSNNYTYILGILCDHLWRNSYPPVVCLDITMNKSMFWFY